MEALTFEWLSWHWWMLQVVASESLSGSSGFGALDCFKTVISMSVACCSKVLCKFGVTSVVAFALASGGDDTLSTGWDAWWVALGLESSLALRVYRDFCCSCNQSLVAGKSSVRTVSWLSNDVVDVKANDCDACCCCFLKAIQSAVHGKSAVATVVSESVGERGTSCSSWRRCTSMS